MNADKGKGEVIVERLRGVLGKLWLIWFERVWPALKAMVKGFYTAIRHRVVPAVGSGTTRISGELVKIHRQQNWVKRCGATLTGNAAGLGMALLSTKVVDSLVETREASNLWGLLADRPVVSDTTFEVLSFAVEYLMGLIVFTITEYYIEEYRRKREGQQGGEAVIEDDGQA